MAFTLSHPAAVLPLKRFCPRYLDFSALVIGAICPDVSYCLSRFGVDMFAHEFKTSLVFCLPVGLIFCAAFFGLRGVMVEWLPRWQRPAFRALCHQPVASFPILLFSLTIGVLTHLVWDSFTHNHGALVLKFPALQMQLFSINGHGFQLCHLLWYVTSGAGAAWLCYDYERWRYSVSQKPAAFSTTTAFFNAAVVGLLVVPIGAVHHLMNNFIGNALVGLFSLILFYMALIRVGSRAMESALPQE